MAVSGAIFATAIEIILYRNLRKILKLLILSAISSIGLLFFGKIFGILSYSLFILRENRYSFKESIVHSGVVFYGGLVGFCIFFLLFGKMLKFSKDELFSHLSIICPAFHSIARVGCYFSGCCYGIVVDGTIVNTPLKLLCKANGSLETYRIPVQLIEACAIFFILLMILREYRDGQRGFPLFRNYVWAYALVRFCLEFIRGDIIRGFLLFFSFSQWVSIILFLTFTLLKGVNKNEKT